MIGPTEPGIDSVVRATLGALTAEASTPPLTSTLPASATALVSSGSISGPLHYPAEPLPAMYVAAYAVGAPGYGYVLTAPGEASYEIDGLSPGVYHVVAYTVGGGGFPAGLAGGYTQAVPCGLGTNCRDHSLIDVLVEAGEAKNQVAPDDWYAPAGTFQPFPLRMPSVATPIPTSTLITGSISGSLMYPASGMPAFRVVAFQIGSTAYYFVDTGLGQIQYVLGDLPPGNYHVVAYPLSSGDFNGGAPGAFSQMVTCGLAIGCADHSLINVVVTSGNTTIGIDPNDFYAPRGTFPPNPFP